MGALPPTVNGYTPRIRPTCPLPAPQILHDETCGLDDETFGPTCPGCLAELPARRAAERAALAREQARVRRGQSRPAAKRLSQLLGDHPELLRPLLIDLLRDELISVALDAVREVRRGQR